ncbi:hypothetical protein CVV38_00360 [Candidatus Peregrinibacteria bacterium HGW-Peregrinibacteria-1]|nr:MAG: hypothetical protein CVV38_00360 [Candidatus Peregrinibacteria bacterium HGW-Peregrinibacteria-1]
MSNYETEMVAIANILKEIEKIDEGSREAALKFIIERLGIKSDNLGTVRTQDQASEVIDTKPTTPKKASDQSIEEFLQNKKPANNYQLIACIGYYLEQVKNIKEFGTTEIREANSDARLPVISNITRDLKNSHYQYNFVMPSGKGKKKLTTYGIEVAKALPDQEKVKTIIKKSRAKINKKSSSKKKINK